MNKVKCKICGVFMTWMKLKKEHWKFVHPEEFQKIQKWLGEDDKKIMDSLNSVSDKRYYSIPKRLKNENYRPKEKYPPQDSHTDLGNDNYRLRKIKSLD